MPCSIHLYQGFSIYIFEKILYIQLCIANYIYSNNRERERNFFRSCPKLRLSMYEHGNMFIGVILSYERNVEGLGESMSAAKVFLKKSQIQMSTQMSLFRNGAQGVVITVITVRSLVRRKPLALHPGCQDWVLFIRVTGQRGPSTSFPVMQNLQEWFNMTEIKLPSRGTMAA